MTGRQGDRDVPTREHVPWLRQAVSAAAHGSARASQRLRAPNDGGADAGDIELFDELAWRLREAHRRVRELTVDDGTKTRIRRRLLAVTDAAKRDLGRASRRLDALLADLDAGRYG